MKNPWGLTQREIEAVEALIQYGVNKTAAHHLGRSLKSIELQAPAAPAPEAQPAGQEFPHLPMHPEPHTMTWTALEARDAC